VQSDINLGAAGARNTAASAAKGEFLAFLDSDDRWLPSKLSTQVLLMDKLESNWAASYTGARVHFLNRNIVRDFHPRKEGDIYADLLALEAPIWTPTFMIRSEVYREFGGMDERLFRQQDIDLYRRLAASYKIAVCPECLAEIFLYTNKHFDPQLIGVKELMYERYHEPTRRLLGPWRASRIWSREWLSASGGLMRSRHYGLGFLCLWRALSTNPVLPLREYARFTLNVLRSTQPIPHLNKTDLG
jgi:glycosyltransferase involved in cell wall biosynthesis